MKKNKNNELKAAVENVKQKVEGIKEKPIVGKTVSLIDTVMKNRYVTAGMFIIQGFLFVFAPAEASLEKLGGWIAGLLLFAAFADIVLFFKSKERNFLSTLHFSLSLIIAVSSAVMMAAAKYIVPALPYLIASASILNGLINIAEAVRVDPHVTFRLLGSCAVDILAIALGVSIAIRQDASIIQLKIIGGLLILNGIANLLHIFQFKKTIRIIRTEKNKFTIETKDNIN